MSERLGNNRILYEVGEFKNFWITPENVRGYADEIAALIHDNVGRFGKRGVILELDGGLNSAVVGALCARAGVDVHAVMLLNGGNSIAFSKSGTRANALVEKFRWELDIRDIGPMYQAARTKSCLAELQGVCVENIQLAETDLQARVRAVKLCDVAQRKNRLLVGTDNLTKIILGDFTRDGNGSDLCPTRMVLESEIRILGKYLGLCTILAAAPSTKLYPGQADEEGRGFTYDQADRFIEYSTSGDEEVDRLISARITATRYKRFPPPFFNY